MLLVLSLVMPELPIALAGTLPLVAIREPVASASPAWRATPLEEPVAMPTSTAWGRMFDELLTLLPKAERPKCPVPTPLLPIPNCRCWAWPASKRLSNMLPEPTTAGVLPGLDSLLRARPVKATPATNPHKHGNKAGEESFIKRSFL